MAKKSDAELRLKIKTEGEKAIQNLQKQLESLKKVGSQTSDKVAAGLEKFAQAMRNAGNAGTGMVRKLGDVSDKFEALIPAISKGVAAIAALGAAILALGVKSAKVDQVAIAFKNLAASQGKDAKTLLRNMREMTDGMISNFDLMLAANKAAMFQIDLEKFPEMLKIAKAASEATGESMDFMLNSIVLAIGRGSKLILDNLGIIIDVEKAYKDYAKTLGKTADALTDTEKNQAFTNEAMRVGLINAEAIGGSADNAAKKWQRFKADTEGAAIALGNKLMPIALLVIGALNRMVDATNKVTKSDFFTGGIAKVSVFLLTYVNLLERAVFRTSQLYNTVKQFKIFGNTKGDLDRASNVWQGFNSQIKKNNEQNAKDIRSIEDDANRKRVEAAIDAGKKIEAADRALAVKIKAERIIARKKDEAARLAGEKAMQKKLADERAKMEADTNKKIVAEKQKLDETMLENESVFAEEKKKIVAQYAAEEAEDRIRVLELQQVEAKLAAIKQAEAELAAKKSLTKEEQDFYEDLRQDRVDAENDIAEKRLQINKDLQKELDDEEKKAAKEREKETKRNLKATIEDAQSLVSGAVSDGAAGAAKAVLSAIAERYMPGLGAIVGDVFDFLNAEADDFAKKMDQLHDASFVNRMADNMTTALDEFVERAPEFSGAIVEAVVESIPEVADALLEAFSTAISPEFIVDVTANIADGIVAGIRDGIEGYDWQGALFGMGFGSNNAADRRLDRINERIIEKVREREQIIADIEREFGEDKLSTMKDDLREATSARQNAEKDLEELLERRKENHETTMHNLLQNRIDDDIDSLEKATKERERIEDELEDLYKQREDAKKSKDEKIVEDGTRKEKAVLDEAQKRVDDIHDQIAELEATTALGPSPEDLEKMEELNALLKKQSQLQSMNTTADYPFTDDIVELDQQIDALKNSMGPSQQEIALKLRKLYAQLKTFQNDALTAEQRFNERAATVRRDNGIAEALSLDEQIKQKEKQLADARIRESDALNAEIARVESKISEAIKAERVAKIAAKDEAIRIRREQVDGEIKELERLRVAEEQAAKKNRGGLGSSGVSTGIPGVDNAFNTATNGWNTGNFIPSSATPWSSDGHGGGRDDNKWTPWANGGIVYASRGTVIPFKPRGTDTVPAALTPGEFVVNRNATMKNRGLLERINSGGSAGGGTTVNIVVNGGFLGDANSARQLARAVDRELVKLRRDNESISFDSSIT